MAKTAQSEFDDAIDREAGERAPPDETSLEKVRDHVRKVRDLVREKQDLEERLRQVNTDLWKLTTETLPVMFGDLGITTLSLKAEGNQPAFSAEAAPYYKANISADWEPERREKAFAWLRKNKLGDLIKAEYSVLFGMKTEAAQKKLRAALKKLRLDYQTSESVPWNTLTAVVRNMIEVEKKSPPLDTLGATVGTVVSVKEVKPTTTSRRS